MPSTTDLDELNQNNQIVTRYVDPTTEPGQGITDETLPFPICPNGSIRNIAGICDPTGLVFGLMPHPEAAYATFLHPHHTRSEVNEEILAEGMQIFRNAVEYAQANL
tara:strand:- start:233 stop:553 length:321 start_codon:yes stop_codon:yes gene_type:complete